jgi:glycosyltransferase 2 family protein
LTVEKQRLHFFLKLSVSLVLVGIVLYRVDLHALWIKLRSVSWTILIMIPVIHLCQIIADTFTKKNIFTILNFSVKARELFKLLYKGSFYGFFMPSLVGSDAYFVVYFSNRFKNLAKILSGLLLYKLISLCIFVTISLAGLIFFWSEIRNILVLDQGKIELYLGVALFTFVLVGSLLLFRKKLLSTKVREKIDQLKVIKKDLTANKPAISRIFLGSSLFYAVSILGRVMIGFMLGIQIPVHEMVLIIILVNLVIMLPLTFSGVGLREAGYILLFGTVGVGQNDALLMALFDFLISLFGVALGGLFVLHDDIRSLRSVKKVTERMQ